MSIDGGPHFHGAQLSWVGPDRSLVTLGLTPDHVAVLIGRTPQASVRLDADLAVSRIHARLTTADGEWVLEDLGSETGTFVVRDGTRHKILGPRGLRDGDRIRVGKTTIRYRRLAADAIATATGDAETFQLTVRERDVLRALCGKRLANASGWPTNRELAAQFVLTEDAVRTHIKNLYRKFGLQVLPENQRRATLIERAVQEGWAQP